MRLTCRPGYHVSGGGAYRCTADARNQTALCGLSNCGADGAFVGEGHCSPDGCVVPLGILEAGVEPGTCQKMLKQTWHEDGYYAEELPSGAGCALNCSVMVEGQVPAGPQCAAACCRVALSGIASPALALMRC